MAKLRVGMVGSAGYTGGELLRILIHHPAVDLVFAHSNSFAGQPVWKAHNDLLGDTELLFTDQLDDDVDFVFLCVGHGDAKVFLENNRFSPQTRIIDLSQDFRLTSHAGYQNGQFIYGLPELQREKIRGAKYIANPGCFATAIQLALLPLAEKGLLPDQIHIQATTGSTGAGQKPTATSHFSWRSNNLSIYKAFEHQHLQEIGQNLNQLQAGFLPDGEGSLMQKASSKLLMIPQRGSFTRGILATLHLTSNLTEEEANQLFKTYYASHPFTHVSQDPIDLKQVVNTNKCLLQVEKHGAHLVITTIIDNLLKGASGQAVQNMNLMAGLEENLGLRLKSSGF
jgi:N-acetyl-gamma-glutamyl-phosphate reductase